MIDSTPVPALKFNPDSAGWPCEFPLSVELFEDIHQNDMAIFKRYLQDFETKGFAQLVIALGNDIVDFVAKGDDMNCTESVSHFVAFVSEVYHLLKYHPKNITFQVVNGLPRLCLRSRAWDWRYMLTNYECTLQYNKEQGYSEDFDYFKHEPIYLETLDEYVEAVAAYMRKDDYAF